MSAVVDLHSKILDARSPLGVQILSISCSFWENLAKLYVGAPPGEVAPPPRGNPGSATGQFRLKLRNAFLLKIGTPLSSGSGVYGGGANSKGCVANYPPKTAWK